VLVLLNAFRYFLRSQAVDREEDEKQPIVFQDPVANRTLGFAQK
jgi:hypothetical protein